MSPISNILTRAPGRCSLIVGLLFVACMSAYWTYSRTPGPCGGLGDCVKYLQMVESFRSGHFIAIDAPFNGRVLGPWLVSLLPTPAVEGFLIVNACAALAFAVTWHRLALTLNLRNVEFAALLTWFMLHPLGFGLYYTTPASVDPLAHVLLGLTTLAYLRRHPTLPILLILGLLAKESFTFICLIIVTAEIVRMRFQSATTFAQPSSIRVMSYAIGALLAYQLLRIGIEHKLFPPADGGTISTYDTLHHFWKEAKREPARFLVWLTSIVCVTGTFPALLVRRWQMDRSGNHVAAAAYLTLGAAGFIALGLLGGSDMSRIIFTGNLLIICATLYPMGSGMPSAWNTLAATLLSLGIALNYTRILPATLEYDYYMNDHRLGPTLTVLLGGILVLIIGISTSLLIQKNQILRK